MTNGWDLLEEALHRAPVIAILRGTTPALAKEAAHAVAEAGIGVLEVTIETDEGFAALEAVAGDAPAGLLVGAGTVRTAEDAARAARVGARFSVSPGLSRGVLETAAATGVPHIPGVATPTEALSALAGGSRLLKAFPASTLGADWIRAMAGPIPEARFVATGGITSDNARAYLDAGAVAVGVSLRGTGREGLRKLSEAGLLGG